MTVVENGCKIVNVDNSQLNTLRQSDNAFDNGAEKILESLDLFVEDMEAQAQYDSRIPYENMFNALKCVIKSAQENEKIRNAIMTGIIQEVPVKNVKAERKEAPVKKQREKRDLNVEEVRDFAKGKTLNEIADHFNVSRAYIKNYTNWHKIEYKLDKSGRKSKFDLEAIKKIAPDMTLSELAKTFMTSTGTMNMFLKRNGIQCRKRIKGGLI